MSGPSRLAFVISAGAPAAALVLEQQWLWVLALVANAPLGVIARRRGGWISAWLVAQIAISALSGIHALLALGATLAGLAYWDLAAHYQRLEGTEQIFNYRSLVRSHNRSLMTALAMGSLMGGVAIGIPLQLSFVAAVFLDLLALAGIATLARRARSVSN
ncbi:MAG: hypothetical protein ACE5JF_00980 [Anaerolineales bacterium]